MTRANLNFVYQKSGEAPRTLFHYQNGDQYPTGLKDIYNVIDFINSDWTPEAFKEWIRSNYNVEVNDLGIGGQPKIYYTDGFITDYSYVFDANHGEGRILVYNWAKNIFEGNKKEFVKWLNKQED